MDFVSFVTAKRLKETGFPQPEPEQGQAWYVLFNSSEGPKSFIKFVIDDIRIAGPGPETAQWTSDINSVSGIFAPTATDILREIRDYCQFAIELTGDAKGVIDLLLDIERLASVWLALHEKK